MANITLHMTLHLLLVCMYYQRAVLELAHVQDHHVAQGYVCMTCAHWLDVSMGLRAARRESEMLRYGA
mgnify:CR=1 FL=1